MSKYVRNVVFKTEFDGDAIELTLRPLTFEQMLNVRRSVPKDESADEQLRFSQDLAALVIGQIVDVRGLLAADGSAIALPELGNAYFGALMTLAGMHLIQQATPASPKAAAS